MNTNLGNRQTKSNMNQRSSQKGQTPQASAQSQLKEQQQRSYTNEQTSADPQTPSGQSNIEAPMSGTKLCNHVRDCNCATEQAIHS
ncbi:hypothetical protein BGZ49_003788, partial [Haplosporangium sp. Z 27]